MNKSSQDSLVLSLLERAHRSTVFERRVQILAKSLAAKIPPGASVLDIGCGNGAIATTIKSYNPTIDIRGIEFAPRPACLIECTSFDGVVIPYPSASFDVCMFVDVLHHISNTHGILSLMTEACRVSRRFVLIKDHLAENRIDFKILQFMDWVGNRPHAVVLPYNYQSGNQWNQFFSMVGLAVSEWQDQISLYPFPFSALFGRRLHYIALLEKQKRIHDDL